MKSLKTILKSKAFIVLAVIVLVLVIGFSFFRSKGTVNGVSSEKPLTIKLSKTFLFSAYSNQGKIVDTSKIKFKITSVDKTSQVLVKDQIFTAKNNKMFLIINLELRNDASQQLNIIPGDLIRIAVAGNPDTKFAPDLHNNVVSVAAISTKMDRVGFVIPSDAKDFTLYVGEIQKPKDSVAVHFSS